MINLMVEIAVKIDDPKSGLDNRYFHKVIGTYSKKVIKDGKEEQHDFFMVIRSDGTITNVFPSKCMVRRIETTY